MSQLVDEINRVAQHAEFNTMNMLTGAFARDSADAKKMQIHVGANVDQNVQIFIGTMTAKGLGIQGQQDDSISIASPDQANQALAIVDNALNMVSKQRADLGAYQNRFEMAAKGVAIASENLTASESRIRDVDMASEMVDYTKNQILTQASTAMLAQANVRSNNVMQLLG